MQVQRIQSQPTFTSLKNPIKAEKFLYKDEFVLMREAKKSDLTDVAKDIKKWMSNSFRLENCMENSPENKKAREIYRSIDHNEWLKDIKQHLIDIMKKDNSSILVARNQNNKLVGYATMEQAGHIKTPTGIIENIHLDLKYRDGNLGEKLLEKITSTAKNEFDDVVVASYSLGDRNFYHDTGYQIIDSDNYRNALYARYGGVSIKEFWLKKNMNH